VSAAYCPRITATLSAAAGTGRFNPKVESGSTHG
jgi:hypothetical protein